MTYFHDADLRGYAGVLTETSARSQLSAMSKAAHGIYDVFLSHCVRDAVLVLGLKKLLEDQKLTVYVDWIEDGDLDRSKVSPATAVRLRHGMKNCRSMVFAISRNASTSRWMPWELGYFDGIHEAEKVAICPIATTGDKYAGAEYLGLYKTLERMRLRGTTQPVVMNTARTAVENARSFASGRGAFESTVIGLD